jgi:hypothetical protein
VNPDTIHSDLDDIVTRGLPPGLELNLDRGKSLPPGWQAKVVPGTIVPDTDDAPRERQTAPLPIDRDIDPGGVILV